MIVCEMGWEWKKELGVQKTLKGKKLVALVWKLIEDRPGRYGALGSRRRLREASGIELLAENNENQSAFMTVRTVLIPVNKIIISSLLGNCV